MSRFVPEVVDPFEPCRLPGSLIGLTSSLRPEFAFGSSTSAGVTVGLASGVGDEVTVGSSSLVTGSGSANTAIFGVGDSTGGTLTL